MEYLLDTHTLIWALTEPDKLPQNIKDIFLDENNDIIYSDASLWEIETKHSKKPSLMPYSAAQIFNLTFNYTNYKPLGIRVEHILKISEFINENIHDDPFDHILLATAKEEGMTLITHDSVLEKYKGVKIISY